MPIQAQSHDGTIHEFPDGTPDAVVDKAMKAYAAPQSAAPSQPQEQSFIGALGSELSGIRSGLHKIPQSVIELGARGLDATGITDNAYNVMHQSNMEDDALMNPSGGGAYKLGQIGGEVLGTLPVGGLRVAQGMTKLPRLAKAADAVVQGVAGAGLTSAANDAPLSQQLGTGAAFGAALPVLGGVASGVGKLIPGVLGETTGAGASSLRNAFQAGKAGGDKAKAFTDSMRGNVPWGQVVDDAKAALGNLRSQRAQAYKTGMVDISKDRAVLDFTPIDEAMQGSANVKNFKGVDLSPKTADARQEVQAALDQWKGLDPAEYHTPEGFDALKQQLGGIKDSYQYGTPQWKIANEAYNAVRGTIAKQAPAYDKVMRDYADASDELASLEKELSLGKKVNPNTALRKLQSVMRDNANTSWGERSNMANRLSEAGATNLLPSLAGQALSTAIPRGLAKYADMAMLGPAIFHNPLLAPAALAASPRAMGEVAYGAGKVARGATNLGSKVPLSLPALPQLSPTMGLLGPQLAYQR